MLEFDLTTYKLGKNNFTPTDLAGLKDCSNLLLYEMGMECVATGLDVSVEVIQSLILNQIHKKSSGSVVAAC